MPSVTVKIQSHADKALALKLIFEIRVAVLQVEELGLKKDREKVSVDILFTQKDFMFESPHVITEISLDKRKERTKKVLDNLCKKVKNAIVKTFKSQNYKKPFSEVWTISLDKEVEGFAST